jgi:hypothetical protein
MPFSVLAADKPSMASLWIELSLLLIVLIVLKITQISNQQKLILFITYVLSGIITKTIWVPVLLFIGLFYIFNQSTDE